MLRGPYKSARMASSKRDPIRLCTTERSRSSPALPRSATASASSVQVGRTLPSSSTNSS
ncbi:Uncharacterised protein [Mycobacterium tuberculosis]|nr:Uncharacterised protein [Mycobacterium tuberculosis]